MAVDNLFDLWAKRNPKWEEHFEDSILRVYTDYGIGSSELTSAKGKALGAGYELYIYAFFIGLYADKRRNLVGGTKTFGQPIQFWGNLDSKKLRKAYPKLREYIFIALIATTEELDLIALEKGEISVSQAVDFLKETMEQYANYGFHFIKDKMQENPNYFYKTSGFLDLILNLVVAPKSSADEIETL
jgi:hypothetical protein